MRSRVVGVGWQTVLGRLASGGRTEPGAGVATPGQAAQPAAPLSRFATGCAVPLVVCVSVCVASGARQRTGPLN